MAASAWDGLQTRLLNERTIRGPKHPLDEGRRAMRTVSVWSAVAAALAFVALSVPPARAQKNWLEPGKGLLWLLDLPLIALGYAQWSRATPRLLRKRLRAEIARDFLGLLDQHRPEEAASEEVAKQLHDRYCAYLLEARDRHGLSFLQPGRFLCRGDAGRGTLSVVAPLDVSEDVDMFAPGTLGALMAERYEVYKREVVERFYQDHFRHYSRQIVLVDVLRALLGGRDAFEPRLRRPGQWAKN
jgi:predicted YcjX-like family ATPase